MSEYAPDHVNILAWPADHIFRIEHTYRYARALFWTQGARVIDAACGSGYGSQMLRQNAAGVYAVDRDEFALTHARIASSQQPGCPIVFEQHDLDTITLPECDIVVSMETIEHLDDPERWMQNMKRVARRIVFSCPIGKTTDTNPSHKHDFTQEQIMAWTTDWKVQWSEVQANTTVIIVMDQP
jgi:2-polyprenyl-3-methyl-5-hydroxy-6-metoxy-1,4-benzoquinol methylase